MKKIIYLFIILICVYLFFNLKLNNHFGLGENLPSLFGVDEFGRDIISVTIISSINSMSIAIFLTILAFFISGLLAYGAINTKSNFIKMLLRSTGVFIESCPILIWLFVIIIALRDKPRIVIVSFSFVLAAIPYLSNIIYGELERLWHSDFIESARIAGHNELKILIHYLLPNTYAIILPVLINVYGAAITINGVIGILGMGNRMDLEIGTLLQRGKENLYDKPVIMILSIISLVCIYYFVVMMSKLMKKSSISH